MKIRYAPLALACALMGATFAQAAPVTYYFGGTLDTVSGLSSLAVGNTFTGSFTFESTALDIYPSSPVNGTYFGSSFACESNVNGYAFAGIEQSATCFFVTSCIGVTLVNDAPGGGDSFFVSSSVFGGQDFSLSGPTVDGAVPFISTIALTNSISLTDTVFNSDELPSSLALSSFDDARFSMSFVGSFQGLDISGPLTYLSATAPPAPVPEPSTSALLALGLGALALVRRRNGH